MPRAPKKCGRDGCENRVVARPYCPEHTPVGWAKVVNPRTGSAAHKAWRKAVLDRDHWRCRIRGARCTGKGIHADHIVPVAWGGPEFDLDNGQAACPTCHAEKTQDEARQSRLGR
ncbi:MAG: HNH endonuclease signature motif containing protein [Actinomycetota bacterium]|nr:HNH endonuclease signature motif containing protein [Actinomycetota bacterium]